MAIDEGAAELIREDLAQITGVHEKRMFGGICFMLNGHMLCGISSNGGMYRVGKDREAGALALPGVRAMDFTKRKMPGFVETDDDAFADDAVRHALIAMALDYVQTLPPK